MQRIMLGLLALFALLMAFPALAERTLLPGLFIKPGETWAFRVVESQPAEARRLGQGEEAANGEVQAALSDDGSMLHVRNRGTVSLNYQAFVSRKPDDKGKRTSVCTLVPNIAVMESWPGGLPGLRLTNFTDAEGGMICA
jgi:hypothetical protein